MIHVLQYKKGEQKKMKQPRYFYNPPNVFDKRKFDFRIRNLAEAAIASILLIVIINNIPFVPKIKIILDVVLGFVIFCLFTVGIKKQSITEWIINKLKSFLSQKTFHYRKIEDIRHTKKQQERSGLNESYADKFIRFIQEKLHKED